MEKAIVEEAKELIADWEDPHIVRPAVYMPVEPLEIRLAREVVRLQGWMDYFSGAGRKFPERN